MVESELPKIAPGLVPQRMRAINQAAPSDAQVFRKRFLDVVKAPIDLRSDDHSSHSGRTDVFSLNRHALSVLDRYMFGDEYDERDFKGWHKRHYDYLKRLQELGTDRKEAVTYINGFIHAKKKLPNIPAGTAPGTPFTMPPPGTPYARAPAGTPRGAPETPLPFPRGTALRGAGFGPSAPGARPSTG
jgi:hypothetical protein